MATPDRMKTNSKKNISPAIVTSAELSMEEPTNSMD
jgi:hypothetical protein